jgi:hypothetical protein
MINLTKKFVVMSIAMSVLLAMSTTSSAARIHNGTSAFVSVYGSVIPVDTSDLPVIGKPLNKLSFNEKVTLNSGEVSDSISWKESWGVIVVDREDVVMCDIAYDFGHAELQGGNYLLISQQKEVITCNLCTATKGAAPRYSGKGQIKESSKGNLTMYEGQESCT